MEAVIFPTVIFQTRTHKKENDKTEHVTCTAISGKP